VSGFVCVSCGERKPKKDLGTASGDQWCVVCREREDQRNQREDLVGGCRYSRPPKYAIRQSEYRQFGY
jgi:hypothetical protein